MVRTCGLSADPIGAACRRIPCVGPSIVTIRRSAPSNSARVPEPVKEAPTVPTDTGSSGNVAPPSSEMYATFSKFRLVSRITSPNGVTITCGPSTSEEVSEPPMAGGVRATSFVHVAPSRGIWQ